MSSGLTHSWVAHLPLSTASRCNCAQPLCALFSIFIASNHVRRILIRSNCVKRKGPAQLMTDRQRSLPHSQNLFADRPPGVESCYSGQEFLLSALDF